MGGIFTKLIQKNTTIPTKHTQTFSTAEDNQPAVTIKVGQGERELMQHNKLLGEFNLEGIAPAMRGVPQIEVTLDLDANGILNVSAKDKNTGKENKITIKSDSGLSEAEIQRMVKEAEENAEADKKLKELIEARNNAEGATHTVKKDFEQYKDKLTEDDKTAFETALADVDKSVLGDDPEAIQKSVQTLFEKAQPIFTAKQTAEQAPPEAPAAEPEPAVVDAEFTEVDTKDKK
jgi:molecular chaperone DnaK